MRLPGPAWLARGLVLLLSAAGAFGQGTFQNLALESAMLIPDATESLRFRAYLSSPSDSFRVALGGQTISLIPVVSGTNYTLYGADIHAWAGQTAELAFTAIAGNPHVSNNYLFLDSIQFSTLPVPEPSVFALCALDVVALCWYRLRRR